MVEITNVIGGELSVFNGLKIKKMQLFLANLSCGSREDICGAVIR